MTAIEAKEQALQKIGPEKIWDKLPENIRLSIETAVEQGRMMCTVTNVKVSVIRRLQQLRYTVRKQGGDYYTIAWYYP